jgi:hypothetical protein
MRASFYPILIGLAAIAAPVSASPITVTAGDVGTSYTVNYDGFSDGQVIGGLTGQVTLTLAEVVDNSFKFDYTVTNTSSDPIDASRISIFGFNTDPNILNATSTGLFDQTNTTSNVPSGFGQVDVCFKGAGGNNCSGGGGTGVNIGDSTSGTLTLNFSEAIDQLTLSDFFVRYQAIEGAGQTTSAIGRGTPSTSTGSTSTSTGGTPVPAPAALWLFATALGLLGLRVGRSRRLVATTA